VAPLCPASANRKLCVHSIRQGDVKPCFHALETWVSRPINKPFRSAVCQLLSPCGLADENNFGLIEFCIALRTLTQFHLYCHSVERLGKERWRDVWLTGYCTAVVEVLGFDVMLQSPICNQILQNMDFYFTL